MRLSRYLPVLLLPALLGFGPPPSAAILPPASEDGRDRPNLILIVVDTLRADHLGSYGYFRNTSPHMDALAGEGVRFDQVVTSIPHTLPAHVSLFTSRYPAEHGVLTNGQTYDGRYKTLAQTLSGEGYATGAFVSGYPLRSRFGIGRGFETFVDARRWKTPGGEATAAAIQWMKKHEDRPFFAWVHLYDPHTPYGPPEHLRRRFQTDESLLSWVEGRGITSYEDWRDIAHKTRLTKLRTPPGELSFFKNLNLYDAEIAHADELVGRLIMDALGRDGVLDRSLVVLTSDHGEGLGEHGFWLHGPHLYDEQLLVPLIFRLPGGRHAGRTVKRQAGLVDVLPTLHEVLGLAAPHPFRGESLAAEIRGEVAVQGPRYVFSESRLATSRGSSSPSGAGERSYAVRTREWKLIRTEAGEEELYSLAGDPQELQNVLKEHGPLAEQLRAEIRNWRESLPAVAGSARLDLSKEERRRLRSLGYTD
jgi:arylsulfatase A-like enzyme